MNRKAGHNEHFLYVDQLQPVVELAYCWHLEEETEYWYRNPMHGLALIERGRIEWDSPNGVVQGVAGDLIYNPPTPKGHHRIWAGTVVYVAGLRYGLRPRFSERLHFGGAGVLPARLPLGAEFKAMRLFMETLCIEVPRDGVEHRLAVRATVYQIFTLIARRLRAEPAAKMKMDDWERIRIRLAAADGHKLKMSDLAREMNLSVQYFRQGFRRRFGSSPKAYQMRSRIREVVRRLRESNTSFKVIAHEMGFRDPKVLYHAICRHLGIGPTKLRRMSSEDLNDRLPENEIPFPLNHAVVPPGTPADWLAKHKVTRRTSAAKVES